MSTETPEPKNKSSKWVREEEWTAQMVGKHFLTCKDLITVDYEKNPKDRVDFTEAESF